MFADKAKTTGTLMGLALFSACATSHHGQNSLDRTTYVDVPQFAGIRSWDQSSYSLFSNAAALHNAILTFRNSFNDARTLPNDPYFFVYCTKLLREVDSFIFNYNTPHIKAREAAGDKETLMTLGKMLTQVLKQAPTRSRDPEVRDLLATTNSFAALSDEVVLRLTKP